MKRTVLAAAILGALLCGCANGRDEQNNRPPQPVTVTFKYVPAQREAIKTVYLTGDFNDWIPRNVDYLMEPQRDGSYTLNVTLMPGIYAYRLVINGKWITNMQSIEGRFEPVAESYPQNGFGGVNAQITVRKQER